MNRKELFQSLLNFQYISSDSYRDELVLAFSGFNEKLDKLDETEIPSGWEEIRNKIKSLQDNLLEAANLYRKGLPAKAYLTICTILNTTTLPVKRVREGSTFYRMRKVKDSEMRGMNYEKMFHIPLTKRNLVQTERFSAPGYPCLYLGFSSYVCWEEMGRPSLDSCMVSKIQNSREFNVIDLSFSDYDIWNKNFCDRIVTDSLVIACMLKRSSSDDKFKDEYSVPQAVMEWIIEHNYTLDTSKGKGEYIYGIYYLSAQKNDQFQFPLASFGNLALPVIKADSLKYCAELTNLFAISDPTCNEWEQIRKAESHIYIEDLDSANEPTEQEKRENNYASSLFGFIEERLADVKMYSI